MQLKVFTAFSGYDSQCMALDRLHEHNPHFNYELVGWAEIDKYAIAAHNAVYPQWAERNYGDIAKIDWAQVPDFDLFTYSSPCQDFSQAESDILKLVMSRAFQRRSCPTPSLSAPEIIISYGTASISSQFS